MAKRRLTYEDLNTSFAREDMDWGTFASAKIKAELKLRGFTYADLVERLGYIGVTESEPNVRNKLSRGAFSAAFLLQCLAAMGIDRLNLFEVFEDR